jgi:hypothetical protein
MYARGSNCIDYVFLTADVAFLVKACDAEPFNHRDFSDPRGSMLTSNFWVS